MKTIVSVSLGSSQRDHQSQITLNGEVINLSRRGVDGQFKQAVSLLEELDGKVDAFGLGGIDIYLKSRNQTFELRDGRRLSSVVKKTPIVDGSGLKNTLERRTVFQLQHSGQVDFRDKKVLMVCAMDRFGMAEALVEAGAKVVFGDMIFSLNRDEPILSLDELDEKASKLLPEICKLPISMIYPTGNKQDSIEPTALTDPYFEDAEIIAGDFHIMRRRLPEKLTGKGILTNTVTPADLEELKRREVAWLVTTTPVLNGRSYGTNVLEAAFVAHLGKRPEEISPLDYDTLIKDNSLCPELQLLS